MCQNQGRAGAGRNEVSTSTCKKCILSRMKPTDKESESIESTLTFKNAFNAMSQAALWHVMNMFHIPDVDLLEQIYDSATVRLAPNDAESAKITFDTGVARGSITSPQLFNIFLNALLRMLTVTGQN